MSQKRLNKSLEQINDQIINVAKDKSIVATEAGVIVQETDHNVNVVQLPLMTKFGRELSKTILKPM